MEFHTSFATAMLTAAASLLLSACTNNNDNDRPVSVFEASRVEGIWSAPAYGKIFEFTRSDNGYNSTMFHVTDNSCLHGKLESNLTVEDLARVIRLSDTEDQIEIRRAGRVLAPGVNYTRLTQLPDLCTDTQRLAVKGESGYQFDPQADFQIFWDTFNELYIDFGLSGTDWLQIYNEAQEELSIINTEEELAGLFAKMITPLQDGHNVIVRGDLGNGVLSLLDSDAEFDEFSVSLKPDFVDTILAEYASINGLSLPLEDSQQAGFETYLEEQEFLTEEIILGYAVSPLRRSANDFFAWFKLEPNIGYLFIDRLAGFADSEFDVATDTMLAESALNTSLTELQDVDGLIIDLRFNDGGEEEVNLTVARHFIPSTHHAYSKQARLRDSRTPLRDIFLDPSSGQQYLGPIVILTSTRTGSAAEALVLSLRDLPNVSVIGEASAGRFSNTLDARVSSDIAFGLSNEYYFSAAGEWFERVGIPVDEPVSFSTLNQRELKRDFAIERSVELLTQ